MLDYFEGSRKCRINSIRLETSARIILNDHNGTDSYGLFLYHIAYEEIAKAVYCLLIHFGKIKNEEFTKPVFRDHESKIILFDKIFNSDSFSMVQGVAHIDGIPINDMKLRDMNKEHEKRLKKLRTETMDLLYVDREEGKWKNPDVDMTYIKNLEQEIHMKILSLDTIYEIISKSNHNGTINNFKITNSDKGIPTIQWDAT